MPVIIPERFAEKMRSDAANKAYEGHIDALIQNTCALITEKADFFPEYTIHGWPHIQAVLNHADKLIPEVTLKELSGRDIALLIAAVILHDMGMFLEKAGVRKLLTGSRSITKTAKLDKYDWKSEWDRYIREIRRYPEEKLLYHFGISCAIEEPDLVKGEFSDLDLLVVGDFLRRHHHCIAHEIALGAMPGDTDVDVMQVSIDALGNTAFNMKDRKCIGILARSHGMPIRETREYIRRELGQQYVEKLFYLMAVLRIADALDADEQRAPDTRRKLQGIRTPVSVQEWTWNQRIIRTDLDWDDAADFKYIEAEPESTTEFVQLEKWLKWLQSELDLSWAVLSECCDTQKYRLSIHRIESNILEEERRESYDEKFITKEARLNANPELLKLLVAPLYDNDPSCGVRELLQNAVDACNERAHLEGSGYRGEVQIRLDTKAKTMTVADNGIGMDENVLLNYYLSAGASYRTSEEWFEKFATDRDSNIVRTGRFGVGVLATFLLGNRVEVTTRHMEDDWGYTFEFGLEPKALDIKRPEAAPKIGTTIVVHLKEDALAKLQADYEDEKTWLNWYRFAEPSVRYWVDSEEYISGKPFIPQDDREMRGWFELPGTEYDLIRWGYPRDEFFCNGIRIPHSIRSHFSCRDILFLNPGVSVLDVSGQLHIDISRSKLEKFQYEDHLENEAIRYAVACLLTMDWSSVAAAANCFQHGFYPFVVGREASFAPFICSSEGYTVIFEPLLKAAELTDLLVFAQSESTDLSALTDMIKRMNPNIPFMVYPQKMNLQTSQTDHNILCGIQQNLFDPGYYKIEGFRICIREEFMQRTALVKPEVRHKFMYGRVNGIHREFVRSVCAVEDSPFDWNQWDPEICPAFCEWSINFDTWMNFLSRKFEKEKLESILESYLGNSPWIPYDIEERRKKFPKAFEELKYYIDRILADREKERGAT